MKFRIFPLSILLTLGASTSWLNAQLLVTEIQSDGASDYWELTNVGNSAVSIANYKWNDSAHTATGAVAIPAGASIAPGESVIFTATAAATFRTFWGIPNSVQVFTSGSAPGLGQNDAITLYDASNAEVFFISYAAGGFTRSGGSPALGGHAGISAGGATAQAMIWDPASGTTSPRYTNATGSNFNTISAPGGSTNKGSPGYSGIVAPIDLSKYVRVGRYDLPEPTRTTPPANNLLAQEASGVTYNWDSNTLFIVGDGGTSVTEVTKTGVLVSTMTLPPGGGSIGTEFLDTEGITYIGGGQFVMTEERERQAVKFTYVPDGTLDRSAAQTVKLGTTIGNVGLEGISYDPLTGGFIFAKEMDPEGLFQTTIDFNVETASNGSPTTVNSTNLFDPALTNLEDMSDVFAFSNLPVLNGQPQAGNLLVLSQESGMIRIIDRAGNILSTQTLVADVDNPLNIQNQTHEGITMDRDGFIYLVSENGGGDIDHPQLWVYAPSNVANQTPTALAFSTDSSSIPENTSTTAPIKVANIIVTDADGVGVNHLAVGGPDATSFQIIGSGLYLKAGTALSFSTKPTYDVTVSVDDTTVGTTPDASANFTLNLTQATGGSGFLRVTEVAPWSSSNSAVGADWFELTNTGTSAIDITGWKMYDSGIGGFASAGLLSGVTSIAAGESVIFIENPLKISAFLTNWFGANPPAGLQIGTYPGPGLSSGGDQVNIYDASGAVKANVIFGASTPAPGPFLTFDNTVGLNATTITQLSALGSNGAFTATATTNEVGSPGTAVVSGTPLVSITATDANAAEAGTDPGTFRISRTGSTISAMTVLYSIATGSGQAASDDYTPALTSPATIPAGQSFVDVTITPVDDLFVETAETVTLTLGDTGSYDVGSPASATVTIIDNDIANLPPTAVVLNNKVTTITENTPTTTAIKVADISITDDGQGTNNLTVTGADAASFEITGSGLYLKAGTILGFATKPDYNVTVEVDDTTVGTTPDVNINYSLAVLKTVAPGSIIISEISPWSSTAASSPIAVDWFEVTNTGTVTANISGWKWNDSANVYSSAVALNAITTIAPGESVIFMQTTDLPGKKAAFNTLWFGANPPAGLQFGTYTGPGLSSTGDAAHLFDSSGNRITGVSFGASPTGPYPTFDNKVGLGSTTLPVPAVSALSAMGVNGAFLAANDSAEIGSPGKIANPPTPFELWLAAKGYTSAGLGSDSDGDGFTDGLEFFFNQNPNQGNGFANMPQLVSTPGGMELAFTRLTNTGGLNGAFQVSGDLTTWASGLPGIDYTVASSVVNGDETSVTYALPGSGPSAPGTSPVHLTPNTSSDPAGASLGGVRVVNEGLVGVGRLSGESLDKFGETQGAASGLFITGWAWNAGQFSGTFNVLPDRGYGDGTSNYAARLHQVDFTFTPYYGIGPVPQSQVSATYVDSTKFTYQDGATVKFTTGLNPTTTSTLLGQTVGTVTAANGPGSAQESLLSFDAEAVHLFGDGSGFVSDEYGTYIARFNAAKQITGITQLPEAARPHRPVSTLNFDSITPPTNGRRNNQGLEGMSVTPDGTRLFALLQSATVQDTNGSQQQTRNNARLFVYDIAGANREAPVLIAEHVVKLPQIDLNSDGSGADGTAAQSEIVALGNSSFLMLPRDGNGLGKGTTVPILFKSVQLVDFASATNILGQYDGLGEQISPAGVLRPGIQAAATAEVINLLKENDLAKFGLNLNPNHLVAADSNTLNEKIEGMALVPDLSTPAANDFFLFIANDNDFQSSNVKMLDTAGNVVSRGDGRLNAGVTNDAMFYAYRLTIDAGGKKFFRFSVK